MRFCDNEGTIGKLVTEATDGEPERERCCDGTASAPSIAATEYPAKYGDGTVEKDESDLTARRDMSDNASVKIVRYLVTLRESAGTGSQNGPL